MPNPFFSARIPPDLFQKIEQHIAETKESKTQILIKALAAYVNHPIDIQTPLASTGVSLEIFTILEKRVAVLEQLLQKHETPVINSDNTNRNTLPGNIIIDNNLDNISDPWLESSELPCKSSGLSPTVTGSQNLQSNVPKLLPAAKMPQGTENQLDNADNTQNNQSPHPKYNLLTSSELRKLTGMTQLQVKNHKRKINEKYKKLEQSLEEKKLLDFPEKITVKKPITVNSYPYELFYAGQNEKKLDVWNLILSDNSIYQTLSLGILKDSK